MEKIILVDGNNLLFRSYFATAYTGNIMRNSKGFPTNAIYGFVNMINKIILEEEPTYMLVAFDKGKTFRHEEYADYKGGRNATPDDLKLQMPYAREVLKYMGIKYFEIDNYEADDIIGTFSEYCNKDKNYIGTIISSDHDLLQLISDDVNMKLLKQKDYIRYDKKSFYDEYGIEPIKVIDLKSLMGDASDNIPGVKGIGEKTALKLLQQYESLDGIYNHLDEISGKLREKLEVDKDNAYMSYKLATIYKEVPLDFSFEDTKIKDIDEENLFKLYNELEFKSLIKKQPKKVDVTYKVFEDEDKIYPEDIALYMEIEGNNYHASKIIGFGIYSPHNHYFINFDYFVKHPKMFDGLKIISYDVKRLITALKWENIPLENDLFDILIAGFLLDYSDRDEISYFAGNFGYEFKGSSLETGFLKAKFIYDMKDNLYQKLEENNLIDEYNNIEMPLTYVLSEMEFNGVNVNPDTLREMDKEFSAEIKKVEKQIYDYAGEEFNISSSIQLGNILFEKLGLKHGKKIQEVILHLLMF